MKRHPRPIKEIPAPMRKTITAVAALCAIMLPLQVPAAPDALTTRWIFQVLIGSEFEKNNPRRIVRRWTRAPYLTVPRGNSTQQALVRQIVTDINQTLDKAPGQGITIVPPDDRRADFLVYFVPLDEFPAIAARNGFDYVKDNWGFFWTYWELPRGIKKAVVLIASDKLRGPALEHFAYEEITQALGLVNDSSVFRDSLFFDGNFKTGDPTRLTARDKQLLRFLYNHLQPGAPPKAIGKALLDHWPK